MGSAFSSQIVTPTSVQDFSSDSKLPLAKGLSYGAITSPSALSGTNGSDVKLVHGNCWEQIEGSDTANILQNLFVTIDGNEKWLLKGNLNHRVIGTTNDTRIGNHVHVNVAPRHDTFMHKRTETHHQPEQQEQPTERTDILEKAIDQIKDFWEIKPFKVGLFGVALEWNYLMNYERKIFNAENVVFVMEKDSIEVKSSEIKNSLHGLITEVKGGKVKAAAAHIKAIAGNINAGLALNSDSPFG